MLSCEDVKPGLRGAGCLLQEVGDEWFLIKLGPFVMVRIPVFISLYFLSQNGQPVPSPPVSGDPMCSPCHAAQSLTR